jgi:hypothetical protein
VSANLGKHALAQRMIAECGHPDADLSHWTGHILRTERVDIDADDVAAHPTLDRAGGLILPGNRKSQFGQRSVRCGPGVGQRGGIALTNLSSIISIA